MQDARKQPRRDLALALEIDDISPETGAPRRGRVGVSRNVSDGGLMLNTPSRYVAGERVAVRVHGQDGRIATLDADVARVEECGARSDEPWRYRVALHVRSGLGDLRLSA